MATLPTVESLGRRPVPSGTSNVIAYRPVVDTPQYAAQAHAGRAMQGVSDDLFRLQDQLDTRMAEDAFTQLRQKQVDLTIGEKEGFVHIKSKDAVTRPLLKEYGEKFETVAEQIGGGLQNEQQRRRFKQRAAIARMQYDEDLLRHLTKEQDAFAAQEFEGTVEFETQNALLRSDDPVAVNIAKERINAAVDRLSEFHAWPAVKTDAVRKKAFSEMEQAQVMADMRADPMVATTKLMLGKDYAANLDPITRERFIDAGIRLTESTRVQAEKEREAQRKAEEEEALKGAYAKLASGSLRKADIESIRNVIGWREYKDLLESQKKQGTAGEDNNPAFGQVQAMLYQNPAEAARMALKFHQSGMIKDAQLSSVLERSNSLQRQEGPRSPYERSRQFIVDSLDPGPMSMDPAPKARLGMAVREFDDWLIGQQEALKRDPDAKTIDESARSIIRKYAIVDMNDLAQKTGIGSRDDPKGTLERLKQEGAKLLNDLKTGKIKQGEFDKRAADLNKQRQAAERALGGN